jgi:hypothetical protein
LRIKYWKECLVPVKDQMRVIVKGNLARHGWDQESTCFHRRSTSGLKAGDGSSRGMMADEEGMSNEIFASVDGSGVRSFLCVINGIFLVRERVGDGSNTLGILWVARSTKSKEKSDIKQE